MEDETTRWQICRYPGTHDRKIGTGSRYKGIQENSELTLDEAH